MANAAAIWCWAMGWWMRTVFATAEHTSEELQREAQVAEVLDLLLPKVSFISVGTNDLTQFLFAADRANPKLAERYDWLSPAILRFMDRIAKNMVGSKVRLAVCGEMGGRRLEALALMGLGFTRFSITPASSIALIRRQQALRDRCTRSPSVSSDCVVSRCSSCSMRRSISSNVIMNCLIAGKYHKIKQNKLIFGTYVQHGFSSLTAHSRNGARHV